MKYRVTLHGRVYEVEVERGTAMLADEYEAIAGTPAVPTETEKAAQPAVPAAPQTNKTLSGSQVITAPMPGNILEVAVKPGQQVSSGQKLMVLEAMKMENEILSPADGVVVEIAVEKGSVVNTGDALISLS